MKVENASRAGNMQVWYQSSYISHLCYQKLESDDDMQLLQENNCLNGPLDNPTGVRSGDSFHLCQQLIPVTSL